LAHVANDFANIKYDSAFVTGADIDKYLQHASTFANHMHGVQIFLSLVIVMQLSMVICLCSVQVQSMINEDWSGNTKQRLSNMCASA
jgi:hypothetical protein